MAIEPEKIAEVGLVSPHDMSSIYPNNSTYIYIDIDIHNPIVDPMK